MSADNPREEEGGEEKNEKENQLKRTKSRELRGGIMYYSCHCIKRNGLQHDCRRTGCGGEPACLVLPDPLCAPSQLARARGLADPAPLAAHLHSQGGASSSGVVDAGSRGGKRFIVCELKGIVPDAAAGKSDNKCCKCPSISITSSKPNSGGGCPQACIQMGAVAVQAPKTNIAGAAQCPCTCATNVAGGQLAVYAFDEETMNQIMKRFENKELASTNKSGPGGRGVKNVVKEEPCTRPGCVHWQPPPPCVWDAPCKADCFETPAGLQPGRNRLTGGTAFKNSESFAKPMVNESRGQPRQRMKLLTPECCTGCCTGSGGGAPASGGPASGLPMLVMKLC